MNHLEIDINLLKACLKRDRKSQNELFHLYAPYAMGVAKKYIVDYTDAKDVFLKAFEKVFKKLDQYDPSKGPLKYWIRRIIVNEALNFLKSKKRFSSIPIEHISNMTIDPEIDEKYNANYIFSLIDQLSEKNRIIFYMVLDGYKYNEIAERFHTTEGTIRSYYMRSRNQLKTILTNNNINKDHG